MRASPRQRMDIKVTKVTKLAVYELSTLWDLPVYRTVEKAVAEALSKERKGGSYASEGDSKQILEKLDAILDAIEEI